MPRNTHPNGKPPKFSSPKALQQACDEYFKWCDGEEMHDPVSGELMLNRYGDPIVIHSHPYTLSGLAKHLGFKSYESFRNYKFKGQAYRDVFNSAKLRVMQYDEERLFDRDGSQGARFALQCGFKEEYGMPIEGDKMPVINIMADIPKNGKVLPDQPATLDTPMPVTEDSAAEAKLKDGSDSGTAE